MKHCLNCYKMLPNGAEVCHYCGAQQATKSGFPSQKFSRCPHCLSYMYDAEHGCQVCGFIVRKKSKRPLYLFGILFLLLAAFVVWQVGLIPGLPYSGKAVSLLGKNEAEVTPAAAATAEVTIMPLDPVEPAGMSDSELTDPAAEAETAGQTQQAAVLSATPTVPAITATPSKAPFLCNGVTTRIFSGQKGGIIPSGTSSNLREAASTEGPSQGVLKPGMTFTVIGEEPVCSQGYLWIEVQIDDTGQSGWTVEAQGNVYWLNPIEP